MVEDYNQNELRAAKMAEEQEWVDKWTAHTKEQKKQDHRAWINGWIGKHIKALKRLGGAYCPNCDSKLDYNHIGYKGDRAYCHSCGWRSDREENK